MQKENKLLLKKFINVQGVPKKGTLLYLENIGHRRIVPITLFSKMGHCIKAFCIQ